MCYTVKCFLEIKIDNISLCTSAKGLVYRVQEDEQLLQSRVILSETKLTWRNRTGNKGNDFVIYKFFENFRDDAEEGDRSVVLH